MSIFVQGDAGREYEVGRSRAPSVPQSRLVTTILGTLFSKSWKTAVSVLEFQLKWSVNVVELTGVAKPRKHVSTFPSAVVAHRSRNIDCIRSLRVVAMEWRLE